MIHSSKRILGIVAPFILALVVIVVMVGLAGWSQSLTVVYRAQPLELLEALLLFVIATLLLGFGLYEALRASGTKARVRQTMYAHIAGLLLSDVTPARSGYVGSAAILKQSSGIPSSQTLAAIFCVQSVSFAFKAAVTIVAIPYFLLRVRLTMPLVYSLAIAAVISLLATVLFLILVWSKRGVSWLDRSLARADSLPLIGKVTRPIRLLLREIQAKGSRVGRRGLAYVAACSISSSLFFALALYPIGLALGILNVSVYDWIILGPLVATLGFVPITPAGLGVQEATYVIILSLMGVPLSSAVPFSLVARFLYVVPDLAGFPILLKSGTEYVGKWLNL